MKKESGKKIIFVMVESRGLDYVMEEISKYPKNEQEIRIFYCLAPENDEEIRRRWGKK